MALHPSTAFSYDELVRGFAERIAAGHVRVTTAPDAPHLALYVYTNSCVIDGAWDEFTMLARGIVLDHEARKVRSLPFPKFFNHGERAAVLPDGEFCAYDKIDGSLGIVFFDGARWRVTTKGSFTSPQSQWAEKWLREHCNLHYSLTRGDTYLAEIVYAENRIVVRYPFEGLVMLGAYASDGSEYERWQVEALAENLGARVAAKHDYPSFDALREAVAGFAADREGFVIHYPDTGYRVKVKGAEYLRIHRLISRVTPLAVWEVMAAGGNLDVIRRDIPEEFWSDFDAIRSSLEARLATVRDGVEECHVRLRDKSDKEVGLMLPTLAEPARAFIFARRKHGEAWMRDPKARNGVCRTFRPTGNVLAGYTPSESLLRASGGES